MIHDLAPDAILLSGEGERDAGGGPELCVRRGEQRDDKLTDAELNILEAERGVIVFCTCVFSGTEKKEESNNDHISNRPVLGSAIVTTIGNTADEADWNWFDSIWWRILSSVSSKHARQSEV